MKFTNGFLLRISPAFLLIGIIITWEFLPILFEIPPYKFPQISSIIEEIGQHDAILENTRNTFLEAVLGFFFGSLAGFLFGVFFAESAFIEKLSLPYLIALNAVPVIAFAPILVSWFGMNFQTRIIITALICFFPLCLTTLRGLNEYGKTYEDLFRIYGGSRIDFLTKFKVRNSIPYVFSGLKLNAVYAVTGALISEFIGSSSGLGFGMLQAIRYLNGPRMWAYIVITCLMGLLFYIIIILIERLVSRHHIPLS